MIDLTESYLAVQYSLRPAKQVERRMLVDALCLLAEIGFPVRDYQYTGMGSIHFVDFAMFHKFLGIKSMLSVELSNTIKNRVQFNAPYKNAVNVVTDKSIGDVIPDLPRTQPNLLWLDYDNVLSDYMLRDLSLAASLLPAGSLLLVTVDTEPPGKLDGNRKHTQHNYDAAYARQYYEQVAGDYVKPNRGDIDFGYNDLPRINIRAVSGAIRAGDYGRSDAKFHPLFNFQYADGHRMVTFGGMIATHKDIRRIRKSGLGTAVYTRFGYESDPCRICIPCLTRKEQMYLDEHMPKKEGWRPDAFELSEKEVEEYANIYRFFPAYAELFL